MKNIFFLFIFLMLSCKKNTTKQVIPTLGMVTESVYASGVVKAENQYTVFSTVSGVLQKVKVGVGENIVENQVLFQIEDEKAQLNTNNAQLVYELSDNNNQLIQDKIREMELRVQGAKDRLDLDESVYLRSKNVKVYDAISEVDFEKAELVFKNSKLAYATALKQLSQLKLQLQGEQNRNKINLAISKRTQNDFMVKSAFSGVLFDVLVKEGTVVLPQTPLAIIGKKNAYLLALDVDENDMVRVKIGQKIIVSMDSYKGQTFEAIVDKIYPIMDERSRTFKIEAHFVMPPQKLYPNLTAEANIVINTKNKVLTIPRSYLVDNEYVIVNENEKRKISIGLCDYQNVEVVKGLKAGEIIYLPK